MSSKTDDSAAYPRIYLGHLMPSKPGKQLIYAMREGHAPPLSFAYEPSITLKTVMSDLAKAFGLGESIKEYVLTYQGRELSDPEATLASLHVPDSRSANGEILLLRCRK